MNHDDTLLSLLTRVRRRDPDTWNRLVDVYGPLVFGWCRRGGLDEHDAHDVGQEVFSDVARGISRFERTETNGSFRGWLRTITRFKIADYWRNHDGAPQGGSEHMRRLANTADVETFEESSVDAEAREGREVCQRVLAYLREHFSEQHWRAFWRTAVDEQPAASVAEELGMTAANVRQVKLRVLRRLRDELAELENFG